MAGTSKGARKFAAKKLADDPEYFSKLSRGVKKPRGGKASSGSFKKGETKRQSLGGKAGKRGPSKTITPIQVDVDGIELKKGRVNLDYVDDISKPSH